MAVALIFKSIIWVGSFAFRSIPSPLARLPGIRLDYLAIGSATSPRARMTCLWLDSIFLLKCEMHEFLNVARIFNIFSMCVKLISACDGLDSVNPPETRRSIVGSKAQTLILKFLD